MVEALPPTSAFPSGAGLLAIRRPGSVSIYFERTLGVAQMAQTQTAIAHRWPRLDVELDAESRSITVHARRKAELAALDQVTGALRFSIPLLEI